jgi:hypothetical protein
MRSRILLLFFLLLYSGIGLGVNSGVVQKKQTTVRTENFPRPPYSGATYYIYERDGEVICTKLEVCNKYDDCSVTYKKGIFKDEEDIQTGEPYGKTKPVAIAARKLRKHVCLTKFSLIP